MEKLYSKINFVLFFILFGSLSFSLSAQTGTCTVLQQPCDSDGVLVTTVTSGMTPPLNFVYKNYSGNTIMAHNNVSSMTDTAYGLPYNVSVYISDGLSNTLWLNSNLTQPFYYDSPNLTYPVCPDTMGSAYITINGGHLPALVEWYFLTTHSSVGTGNPINLPMNNTYYFFVTDSNGCIVSSLSDSIGIGQIPSFTFSVSTTMAHCASGTGGTASITNLTGGVSPFSYHWFNGLTTDSIGNLLAGWYYVNVIDSQGCESHHSFGIYDSTVISVNPVTTPATCLQNDGSIISFGSNGHPPYTYQYSNGTTTQEATGLTGGNTYYITVTDANGCYGTTSAYVWYTTPITVTYSTTPSSCTSPTGGAFLTISGGQPPYNIEWAGYPAQTDTFLTNVSSGYYHFNVTDQNGCVRSGTVHIPDNGNMGGYVAVSLGNCSGGNSFTANAWGSNPPFSYLWSTGDTTQTISGLPAGSYTVTVTDSLGCFLVKSGYSTHLLSINFSSQDASCLFVADGSLTANVLGGNPPYNYSWSFLGHPSFSFPNSATISGLYTGYYGLYVTGNNGCWAYDTVYVGYDHSNDSCYCTVTGKVYVDANSNCTYDVGEETVPNIQIHCDSLGSTFTDTGGVYTILVPTGNYTLSEVVQYYYPLAPCQNNQISLNVNATSGCTMTYDFANVINPIHDIKIISPVWTWPVIGNNYIQKLIISNLGTVPENNIQFGYSHDGQLTFLGSTLSGLTQNDPSNYPDWYSVNSGFPTLNPGNSYAMFMNYFVPMNIPLGTEVDFNDTVAFDTIPNWLNDYSPWNNLNHFYNFVLGSCDPNFKEVFPQGVGPQGYITTSDSELTYVIHFQNIGNYYADKVVIVDTLDPNLDITTLRPEYSTHNFRADLSETGVLTFTFEHIHLATQPEASKGLITFSIKQKPSLAVGTIIRNKASVFFDYNPPVTTNTVINTITTQINTTEQKSNSVFLIYPNPASSKLYVASNDLKNFSDYTIYDVTGRIVIGKTTFYPEISISTLKNGLYFIEFDKTDGSKNVAKFVKE